MARLVLLRAWRSLMTVPNYPAYIGTMAMIMSKVP